MCGGCDVHVGPAGSGSSGEWGFLKEGPSGSVFF